MRNLSGLLLASSFLTGCIIVDDNDPGPGPGPGPDAVCGDGFRDVGEVCDDGNRVSGDGCSATCSSEGGSAQITASWDFLNYPDTATACPTGYNTIAHYSQPVDNQNAPVGQPFIDLYDCDVGTDFTDPLAPGAYQTWIESTSENGAQVYASSLSAIVSLNTDDDIPFNAAIFHDAGYFMFSWDLVAASNGAPVSCTQADADGVEMVVTVMGGSQGTADKFDCEAGAAVTPAYLQGSYTVSVDAFKDGAGGGALNAPVNKTNQVITGPNTVTDTGNFVLEIDAL